MKVSHWKRSTRVQNTTLTSTWRHSHHATFKMCYEHFHSTKLLCSGYLSRIMQLVHRFSKQNFSCFSKIRMFFFLKTRTFSCSNSSSDNNSNNNNSNNNNNNTIQYQYNICKKSLPYTNNTIYAKSLPVCLPVCLSVRLLVSDCWLFCRSVRPCPSVNRHVRR